MIRKRIYLCLLLSSISASLGSFVPYLGAMIIGGALAWLAACGVYGLGEWAAKQTATNSEGESRQTQAAETQKED